jgi:hypothetical protein
MPQTWRLDEDTQRWHVANLEGLRVGEMFERETENPRERTRWVRKPQSTQSLDDGLIYAEYLETIKVG